MSKDRGFDSRLVDYSCEYSDQRITKFVPFCLRCGSDNVRHVGGIANSAWSDDYVRCFMADFEAEYFVRQKTEMYPKVRV